MRGSPRIGFYLNTIYQFLHSTFRLQQFFTIWSFSDFAYISKLNFHSEKLYNGEKLAFVVIFFHLRVFWMRTMGYDQKKLYFWDARA